MPTYGNETDKRIHYQVPRGMMITFIPGETKPLPLYIPHESLGLTRVSEEPRVPELCMDSGSFNIDPGHGISIKLPECEIFKFRMYVSGGPVWLQFNTVESPHMTITKEFEYTQQRARVETLHLSNGQDGDEAGSIDITYSIERVR